ncbi:MULTISPECIES: methylamine dehydrogenase light chain [unclassified Sphingobium]|uniref:methylamine dehydrogenase light chain n=1 Tax=unclassified Sphingobium TaxID=2611147 RepID=UPI000D172562|nr:MULTISPECIES: methylamine dehydrogenase light chain [unclassified Sphingobium]PSO10038.1 methylamine dehydrogenase (amicyanin) light chain [Sphingobium sp. AEW4]
MNRIDRITERMARQAARTISRRSFIGRMGILLTASASAPLLPVSRAWAEKTAVPVQESETGDPASCDYWRYCAIDGFLCACCGGSPSSCPPGTEPSPITWVGTCRNPADGKNYVISYNDCCGKTACGRCECNRNEDDTPVYQPSMSNDINWCLGTASSVYNCSTSVVLGVAD